MMIDLISPAIQYQIPNPRVEKTPETEEARQSPLDLAQGKVPRLPKVVEWKKEHLSGEVRYDAKGHLVETPPKESPSPPDQNPVDITV